MHETVTPVETWEYHTNEIDKFSDDWELADREMHEARERAENFKALYEEARAKRAAAYPEGNPDPITECPLCGDSFCLACIEDREDHRAR